MGTLVPINRMLGSMLAALATVPPWTPTCGWPCVAVAMSRRSTSRP